MVDLKSQVGARPKLKVGFGRERGVISVRGNSCAHVARFLAFSSFLLISHDIHSFIISSWHAFILMTPNDNANDSDGRTPTHCIHNRQRTRAHQTRHQTDTLDLSQNPSFTAHSTH